MQQQYDGALRSTVGSKRFGDPKISYTLLSKNDSGKGSQASPARVGSVSKMQV
jgi:hypothetical protein